MDKLDAGHGGADAPLLSRLVLELIGAAVVFGFGATVVMGALEHPVGWSDQGPQAGTLPFWLGLIAMGASIGIAIQALLKRRALSGETVLGAKAAIQVARFLLPIVALVALTVPLGLYLAMSLYLVGMVLLQGHGWKAALVTAAGAVLFNWVAFEYWFMLPLPKGPIEAWLGLA
ncbi:tripartite tricarboxylate transporter TctB family protein [Roseomonas marmotae]|uniref:Tripartite tricarboxylate transporter TctB family protein n=1 Tax=Roseomonas marmotae TaxID=2768161 RepID=A0ABS3KDE8_9PROT|nr:tripartite tricarboxylate transporter TctB family protein [Roseomonas marmotae]MBO1074673.1 tripartite tricarboxylate transporter TctB family protein [Roseomonas marmotae]QTI81692.1 tripartite tricarboxylate transporter TctB family protein [Roseomonas marmotae]